MDKLIFLNDNSIKITLFVPLFFVFFSGGIKSQSQPNAFVEDYNIQDVIVKDNSTFYATSTDIIKVDSSNNKTIVDDRHLGIFCKEGEFYAHPDGWTYLGWIFQNFDQGYPALILAQYQNDTLSRKTISFLNQLQNVGTVISATYQSTDSIFILAREYPVYQIRIVNSAAEILKSSDYNILNDLNEMILIDKNINLIIGENDLYILNDNIIVNQSSFQEEIIDVKYYENNKIEVLTEKNIYWLDTLLNIQKTIPLPVNSRLPKAIYTVDDLTYLIEIENDQSYISSLDSLGNSLSEFVEIPNVIYDDLNIYNNRFNIWGDNDCFLSGSIVKMDIDGLDYAIPMIDIGIDEFVANLDSVDVTFPQKKYFSWQITVTNYGDEFINKYTVTSTTKNEGWSPYISFNNQDPLSPGESRIHEGEFSYIEGNFGPPSVRTWIGSDNLDEDCSNNTLSTQLVTNTIDNKASKISLYPNPATSKIWIKNANNFSFKIYDMAGVVQASHENYNEKSIGIDHLPSGLYIIEIQAQDYKVLEKFSKY